MLTNFVRVIVLAVFASVLLIHAQTVIFNEPVQWTTQRNDSLTVKVQIDTAQLKGKQILLSASICKNGQVRNLGTKSVKPDDVNKEYSLGYAKTGLLGGTDFIRFNWSVAGEKNGGESSPVGIVNIAKLGVSDTITATRLTGAIDAAALASSASLNLKKIGAIEAGIVWNDKVVGLVCRKSTGSADQVCFAIDGKNSRSAFLAYSDKFIRFWPSNDSCTIVHFERQITDKAITYNEKILPAEIKVTTSGQISVVTIPWYDLDMLPLLDAKTVMGGRHTGFAIFMLDKAGKPLMALPATAKQDIPGTWGNLKFALK